MGNGKGQISAEMILVFAILLGLVLTVAARLQETARSTAAQIQNQSLDVQIMMNETSGFAKRSLGDPCISSRQCKSGECADGICT